MTELMAVDFMENEIRCVQRARYCDRDCAKCHLVRKEEALLEAYGMAVRALEKQVAKKPNKEKVSVTGVFEGIVYACPLCGTYVAYSDENGNHGFQMEYCGKCGQKIDLEVE